MFFSYTFILILIADSLFIPLPRCSDPSIYSRESKMTDVTSYVSPMRCACRQCQHMETTSSRCECCVYLLQGKRSNAHVDEVQSISIKQFDDMRDNDWANSRGFREESDMSEIRESEVDMIRKSLLINILSGDSVLTATDVDRLQERRDREQENELFEDFFQYIENVGIMKNEEENNKLGKHVHTYRDTFS